ERGTTRIPRLMLERLVDEVSSGAADPATYAEAGRVRATTAPETITHECGTVIWWDRAAHPKRIDYPWSDAELAALRTQGVALPAPDEVIRRRTRAWLRPVLNARSRLILVVHDSDRGRHPLWSRLTSVARGFNEVRIEDALLGGDETVRAVNVPLELLEQRPLPERRRWW